MSCLAQNKVSSPYPFPLLQLLPHKLASCMLTNLSVACAKAHSSSVKDEKTLRMLALQASSKVVDVVYRDGDDDNDDDDEEKCEVCSCPEKDHVDEECGYYNGKEVCDGGVYRCDNCGNICTPCAESHEDDGGGNGDDDAED